MTKIKSPNRLLMQMVLRIENDLFSLTQYRRFHCGPDSCDIQPEDMVICQSDADEIVRLAELLKANPELIVCDVRKHYQKLLKKKSQ